MIWKLVLLWKNTFLILMRKLRTIPFISRHHFSKKEIFAPLLTKSNTFCKRNHHYYYYNLYNAHLSDKINFGLNLLLIIDLLVVVFYKNSCLNEIKKNTHPPLFEDISQKWLVLQLISRTFMYIIMFWKFYLQIEFTKLF